MANNSISINVPRQKTATIVMGNGIDTTDFIARQLANQAGNIANVVFIRANGAYAQANIANGIAVQSGAQANSAFVVANTANAIAIQSGTQANSAFAAANVANTIAVQSGVQANVANTIAVQSGSQANSAFTTANNALPKTGGIVTGSLNIANTLNVTSGGTDLFTVSAGGTVYGSVFTTVTSVEVWDTVAHAKSRATGRLAYFGDRVLVSAAASGANSFVGGFAMGPIVGDIFSAVDAGFTRAGPYTIQVGPSDTAAPVSQNLSFQSVSSGTANTNGVNTGIILSKSTGSGVGGNLVIYGTQSNANVAANSVVNAPFPIATFYSFHPKLNEGGAGSGLDIPGDISAGAYLGSGGTFSIVKFGSRGAPDACIADNAGVINRGGQYYGWVPSTDPSQITQVDTKLFRDNPGIVGLRNGANAQTFRVYNTYTNASSFEAHTEDWQSKANTIRVGTIVGANGGTARSLELMTGNVTALTIDSTLTINTAAQVFVAGRDVLTHANNAYNRANTTRPTLASDTTVNVPAQYATLDLALLFAAQVDFNGFTFTIQLANGTYTATPSFIIPVTVGQKTASNLIVRGNIASPSSVIVTSATSFSGIFDAGSGARCRLQGLQFKGAGNTFGFHAGATGYIEYLDCDFNTGLYAGAVSESGASAVAVGNLTVSANMNSVVYAINGGFAFQIGSIVTISGTPAWIAGYASADATSLIRVAGGTSFVGSATGPRFSSTRNAVIDVSGAGANYLPGNTAGTTSTGGLYS